MNRTLSLLLLIFATRAMGQLVHPKIGTHAESKVGRVSGWENLKVGAGARTIELSPSGRYLFAACNNVSQLCVADVKEWKVIATINVDSYPVGLDVSKDGKYVIVTSQGKENGGGNAVNIYKVEYGNPLTTNN